MPVQMPSITPHDPDRREHATKVEFDAVDPRISPALALLAPFLNNTSTTFPSYSSQIYFQKDQTLRAPEITPNLAKIEGSAKARLPPEAYNYAAGGAGLESTIEANREAFDHV